MDGWLRSSNPIQGSVSYHTFKNIRTAKLDGCTRSSKLLGHRCSLVAACTLDSIGSFKPKNWSGNGICVHASKRDVLSVVGRTEKLSWQEVRAGGVRCSDCKVVTPAQGITWTICRRKRGAGTPESARGRERREREDAIADERSQPRQC